MRIEAKRTRVALYMHHHLDVGAGWGGMGWDGMAIMGKRERERAREHE